MRRRSQWTADEVEVFLKVSADSQLEVAWHLVAVAGLRAGEVSALRWSDIDTTAALIHVRHAVVGVPYATLVVPRSATGERVVDALPVLDVLDRHYRRQEARRSEWGAEYRDEGLAVCCEDGGPIHPQHLHHAFARSVRVAGLSPIRLWDLRRSQRLAASPTEAQS